MKKGKKAKAGKAKAAAAGKAATGGRSSETADPHAPTEDAIAAVLASECPDMESAGVQGDLIACLAAEVTPAAVAQYLAAVKAAAVTVGSQVRLDCRSLCTPCCVVHACTVTETITC